MLNLQSGYTDLIFPVYLRRNFRDRKSTRLNSSHANISYAVFCLKKKKKLHPNFTLITDCTLFKFFSFFFSFVTSTIPLSVLTRRCVLRMHPSPIRQTDIPDCTTL